MANLMLNISYFTQNSEVEKCSRSGVMHAKENFGKKGH